MNVLIACEESQRVCLAFRARGHNAFSCDILPCSGGHQEYHIMSDCTPLLNGYCEFITQDGKKHKLATKWDLIIAHPPCTRLCLSGQRWLYYGDEHYRSVKMREFYDAVSFFMKFTNINCERVAIENPIGVMSSYYRKPDQIYNPYDFRGETECKKTCLWLKNLSCLVPTQVLPEHERTHDIFKANFGGKQYAWNDKIVSVMRSKTPLGVADAMASQWG